MSYEIVKSIKIDKVKKEVWIRSSSNNVSPKTFNLWHCKSLSEIFRAKGIEALEKEILFQYFQGTFQKTNNSFEKSLILLDRKEFNWSTVGFNFEPNPDGGDPIRVEKKYSEEEVKAVLYKNYIAYKKRKKGVFVIQEKENKRYVTRFSHNGCFLSSHFSLAKKLTSREEALYKLRNFYGNKYEILEIN